MGAYITIRESLTHSPFLSYERIKHTSTRRIESSTPHTLTSHPPPPPPTQTPRAHAYPPTHHGFRSPPPPAHRMARRPSHPQRGGPPSSDPFRPGLGPRLHVARRGTLQDRRPCKELLRHLPLRPRRSPRFQGHVQAV